MLLFPRRPGGLSRRAGSAASDSKDARAINADIPEVIEVADADVQGLPATHRETGNRAIFPVGVDAIMTLRVRHNVVLEVFHKFIHRSPRWVAAARTSSERSGVTRRHD